MLICNKNGHLINLWENAPWLSNVQAYIYYFTGECSFAVSQACNTQCNLSLIKSNRNTNLIPMDKLKQIWMEFHFHGIHIQRKPFPSIFIVFPCLVITLTNQWNVASIYGGTNTFHLIQTAKVVHAIYLSIQQLPYCSSRITHNLSILHAVFGHAYCVELSFWIVFIREKKRYSTKETSNKSLCIEWIANEV